MALITWNPNDKSANTTLSNNNMTASVGLQQGVRATAGKTSGKWYWEVVCNSSGAMAMLSGLILNKDVSFSSAISLTSPNLRGYYAFNGNKNPENVAYGQSYGLHVVIGVALDLDNGTLGFYRDGVFQGISHTNIHLLGEVYPGVGYGSSASPAVLTANFGATEFDIATSNPLAWDAMIEEGYVPYDSENAEWLRNVLIQNVQLSQTNIWDNDLSENINIIANIVPSDPENPLSTNVDCDLTINEFTFTSSIPVPNTISVDIPKSNFNIGINTLTLSVSHQDSVLPRVFTYDIIMEDRDTFTITRRFLYDTRHTLTGNAILDSGKGIRLNGAGVGSVVVNIPTEGKAQLSSLTVSKTGENAIDFNMSSDMNFLRVEGTGNIHEKSIDVDTFLDIFSMKVGVKNSE